MNIRSLHKPLTHFNKRPRLLLYRRLTPPSLIEKIRASEDKSLKRLAPVTIAASGRPRVLIPDSVFQKGSDGLLQIVQVQALQSPSPQLYQEERDLHDRWLFHIFPPNVPSEGKLQRHSLFLVVKWASDHWSPRDESTSGSALQVNPRAWDLLSSSYFHSSSLVSWSYSLPMCPLK